MPRSTTVTVTAAAVTLACLGASLYVSPPVVAETMGRQVQTFSPMKPETYPVAPIVEDDLDLPVAQDRQQSVTTESSTTTSSTQHALKPAPRQVDEVTPTAVTADQDGSSSDPDSSPTKSTRELSTVEVAAPELTVSESPDEETEDPSPIPEDLDSPDSVTVIVNKLRPLPADYEPTDLVELPAELGAGAPTLREEAAEATQAMFEAAQEDGISLTVISAYRSYDYQTELYNNYVQQYGTAATNEMSAQPGFSEHQTGLALDVDTPDGQHTLKQSFGQTPAGQWLAERAHEFGFVIRYPEDEHEYTGFHYEPWHLRYFGEQYAQHIVEHSGVAEREFELDPAPDYQE